MITYREFAPGPELGSFVRAFFSFMPEVPSTGHRTVTREVRITRGERFDLPILASAEPSVVLDLGAECDEKGWAFGKPLRAQVVGALRCARCPAVNFRSEMIGAYLKPWATFALLNMPAVELTDQNVSLEDVWGSRTAQLAAQTAELDEAARVDRLEAALLEQLRRKAISSGRVDVVGLAQWAQSKPISVTVSRLADAAGISRRHLNRVFREVVGVSPKRYCRLARFQTALKYAGGGTVVKWAEVAAELGYADQSHLIAEFRELSGLTPEMFNAHRWFHPFMATQSRLGIPTGRPKD